MVWHRRYLLFLFIFIHQPILILCQFAPTIDKISAYSQKFPKEIVYVHVDREVYYPGDTIWFKAYLRDKGYLENDAISRTIFSKIVDGDGKIIHESKHLVFNSESISQIELSRETKEGLYQFICYSSWMKNDSVAEVFKKTIRIKKEIRREEQFFCTFNKSVYQYEDTVEAKINFLDKYSNELEDVKIRYDIRINEKSVKKGTYNTSSLEDLQFTFPDGKIGLPLLKLSTIYKGDYYDTIFQLPVIDEINIDFFPEGGNFIQDLSNRVAFKAYYGNEIPIEIKGEIHKENGRKLLDITSEHNGMGSFALIPELGDRMYLKITEPPNIQKWYYLPKIQEKGWVLNTVYQDQELTVIIKNNLDTISRVMMTVSLRDQLLYHKSGKVDRYSRFSIPTKDYPAGVAVVTLFDQKIGPQAERLVFINKELTNKVSLETDYSSYLPRDSVKLKIKITDPENKPVSGTYSLSVVDEELCLSPSIDEPNIIASLWLKPEIQGRIVNPEYYFSQSSSPNHRHLDLLLLTQGWRRYRYKNMLENDIDSMLNTKYYEIISGELRKRRYARNSIPTRGTIRVYAAGNITKIETDERGKFKFLYNYDPWQSPNITLFGEDQSGGSNVEIILEDDGFKDRLKQYLNRNMDSFKGVENQNAKPDSDIEDQFALGLNTIWLDEVMILGKQQNKNRFRENGFINTREARKEHFEGAMDIFDVLQNMGLPVEKYYEKSQEMIYYYGYPKGPVTWFMDDLIWSYQDVKYTNPDEIDALFVVKYPENLMFGIPFETRSKVLISIHTKPISERKDHSTRFNILVMDKFILTKEFYKPAYDTDAKKYNQVPDLRKTIHWEPNVTLDENGETSIIYYNGDRYSQINCILEGINDKGIPTFGSISYNIYTVRNSR